MFHTFGKFASSIDGWAAGIDHSECFIRVTQFSHLQFSLCRERNVVSLDVIKASYKILKMEEKKFQDLKSFREVEHWTRGTKKATLKENCQVRKMVKQAWRA